MSHRLDRVVRAALSEPWYLPRNKFSSLVTVLSYRLTGQRLDGEVISEAIAADAAKSHEARRGSVTRTRGGATAVIPVFGIIAHRMNMVNNASGPMGTSIEWLKTTFRQMEQDPEVGSIVLEFDSPGGSVSLIDEMATEIRQARTRVVAQVNDFAASAAYYLASSADEIVVTPSGQVGSIGVVAAHTDISGHDEQQGIKTTLISAGEGKTAGNEFEPLTDEAHADIQKTVDGFYGMFVDAVVSGRNAAFSQADKRTSRSRQSVTAATVRDEWQAKVFMADEAVSIGMADRVGTMDQTLAQEVEAQSRQGMRAERQGDRIRARQRLGVGV